MAISWVRSGGQGGAVGSTARGYSSNDAGNLLVIAIFLENATDSVTSVTDTKGNTWVPAITKANGMVIYYAANCAASAGTNTVTVVINNSNRVDTLADEYTGVALTSPVDATAQGTLSTNPTSGNLTTTVTGDLIYGFSQHNGGSYTVGSGFTNRASYVFNTWNNVEDKIAGAPGTYAANYTNAATGVVQAVAFKPFVATPSVNNPSGISMMGAG
jgi:hypothetical protein